MVAGGGGLGHVWLLGACMVVGGGHAWLPRGKHGCQGVCIVAGGVCMVVGGGHAWLPGGVHRCQGGMHGCRGGVHGCGGMHGCRGACVVVGGLCGCRGACRIRRDTVNERAVRILLECILVWTLKLFSRKLNVFVNGRFC